MAKRSGNGTFLLWLFMLIPAALSLPALITGIHKLAAVSEAGSAAPPGPRKHNDDKRMRPDSQKPETAAQAAGGSPQTGARNGDGFSTSAAAGAGPKLEEIPAIQKHQFNAAPEVVALFENGLRFLRNGEYLKARLAFTTIIRSYPVCALEAPAYLAIGISWYREGGLEPLMLAADQFRSYLIFFGNDRDLQDFAEVAQIDLAVTELQLMQYAATEEDRLAEAQIAAKALQAYLEKWPAGMHARAARTSLKEVENYLAIVR